MTTYQLPMLECSSCGQFIGPFYDDYYALSKRLIEDLARREVPTDTYTTEDDDIGPFIKTYYEWHSKQEDKSRLPVHTPANIVARALLRLRELTPTHLPFGSLKVEDGQMSMFEARMCCLRMFQTDPTATDMST